MDEKKILLRIDSHRAGERLDQMLGRHPDYYYDLKFKYGGRFVFLSEAEAAEALKIKSIKRPRLTAADVGRCWH